MTYLPLPLLCFLIACSGGETQRTSSEIGQQIGSFVKLDPSFDSIVGPVAKAEIIGEGFDWSEGPVWVASQSMLLFSDVPKNTVYKWTQAKGMETYLEPSGYTGAEPSASGEPGSNGLTLDSEGNLVLCQHGDRQVAKMQAPLHQPAARFEPLATRYSGMRFNSPNDLVFSNEGELLFTDPPYGLPQQMEDPTKETPFNGVYKVRKDGTVLLLVDSITRPNGIAFFPDGKRLLIANSDRSKQEWFVYDVVGDSLANGKIFFSEVGHDPAWVGNPDGLKIDRKGNVYATGPGGVSFFNSSGAKLGMLRLENPASNCALSPDEKTLFVTNDMYILKVTLRE